MRQIWLGAWGGWLGAKQGTGKGRRENGKGRTEKENLKMRQLGDLKIDLLDGYERHKARNHLSEK
jgi:hypothetical protein